MKNDIQIQQDVIDQIKWEPILNAAEIGVSVKNGVVTLSGIVDSYAKKLSAENAARKVSGVRAVAEDIQVGVSPAYKKSDTEIAEAVANAFYWNTSVPDDEIKVKVEDGTVTLEGEVEWAYQRNAAQKAVENLAGVRRINNLILLNPGILPGNVKQKIFSAFHRTATLDAEKIGVDVIGSKVILTGKVRSYAEREDAAEAAWSAPGVTTIENKISVQEEEEFAF